MKDHRLFDLTVHFIEASRYFDQDFFLLSRIFLIPYNPPAASNAESPPSIGVAGGAPCAITGTTASATRISVNEICNFFMIANFFV